MVKVKILLCQEYFGSNDDDYNRLLAGMISEWENLSDEDFKYLKDNWYGIRNVIRAENMKADTHGLDPVLVVEDFKPVGDRILSMKALIEQERRQKEETARKREETATAKKLAKLAKDEEAKRKLYEKLKAEYETAKGNLDVEDPNDAVGQYRG